MPRTLPKPVEPIPPTPPWDAKFVLKYLVAGRLMDIEICMSRQEHDPEQHPDWHVMATWFGSVAARILS